MKIKSIIATAVIFFCACSTPKVETFTEAADPILLSMEQLEAWKSVEGGVNAAWASSDYVYPRSIVPTESNQSITLEGWQGEKVSAQLLIWSSSNLNSVACNLTDFNSDSGKIGAEIASTHFVRYTIADQVDKSCLCGRPNGHPSMLQADMLDCLERFDIEANTVRPVWVSIAIPKNAKPVKYDAELKISHNGRGSRTLKLQLEVIGVELAAAKDWSFHLDLWQHPSAVARAEGVEMWSDEHFAAMRPVMQMLANAGQKVITATLNRDPWRYQCFDDYEPMIFWTLHDNGVWSYDYTIFDRWVEFMMSLGIDKQINCYSMLPWGECSLDYHDMRSGKVHRNRTVSATPKSDEFEAMWGPFLVDFAAHLRSKGWLGITNIAIDERAPEDMDAAAALIKKYAPELGFAIADNHNSYKRYANMRDVCVGQKQAAMSVEEIADRRAKGYVSTFYVCCSTLFPNTFTNSQPFESELLGAYAMAYDYDGMLRWSYNSWPANPMYDSRFRRWASGDTYLIYPGARSSVRFERLIDGIELYEKVRLLRKKCSSEALEALDQQLELLRVQNVNDPSYDWATYLQNLNKAVNKTARESVVCD
jgi:hypothetical protein